MTAADLVWGAPEWTVWAGAAAAITLLAVLWSYVRAESPGWVRVAAALLKAAAVIALALCLAEPLRSSMRPRPQANTFVLLADNSASLQIRDRNARRSRAELLRDRLSPGVDWLKRLGRDFQLRRYAFDTRLHPVADFSQLTMDGQASSLATSLTTLAQRFRGRPVAGVLLLTDGNATDLDENALDWAALPPIYPVPLGQETPAADISVTRVSVTQTNFEAAPVTVLTEITQHGFAGQNVVVQLLDDRGDEVSRHVLTGVADDKPLTQRFQLRPAARAVHFYQVRAFAESEQSRWQGQTHAPRSSEATPANNTRQMVIDRGGGPYRVLYVAGRPNWEYKFLNRALEQDDDVQLVALVRMAKREPRFAFRRRAGETTNPFYRGFDQREKDQVEQYDEPVLLRLATEDQAELRDGFPKTAEQLFRYHAVVLDDLEAGFFTHQQMALLQQFVSHRGGGLLMLGGKESFEGGGYENTPIGQMLPVYLDRDQREPAAGGYRLRLTRDGLLQPWTRLRPTEAEETKRIEQMPSFKTLNRLRNIKPGASVLAQAASDQHTGDPALVVQSFGNGRSAALLVGDLWRWQLRREDPADDDLGKSWRQLVRWLVANVPQRVQVQLKDNPDASGSVVELRIDVRNPEYAPLDNAHVTVQITTPDGHTQDLTAEPHASQAGIYTAHVAPPVPGAYRARVVATAEDGSQVGQRETGWVTQPATAEFRQLAANTGLLQRLAQRTGGQIVPADQLDHFAESTSARTAPVVEPWVYPLWHQWSVFAFAVGCLIGEWGLRRWQGLP